MSAQISDHVLIGIKNSQTKPISFEYASLIQDGIIHPCEKDSRIPLKGHPGYSHNESQILGQMLGNYISMKFTNIAPTSETIIKATLKDFWIEQFSYDSSGKQAVAALIGGETNIILVSNLQVEFEIFKQGQKLASKNIKFSADKSYVSGIGTRTSTSRIYKGQDSIDFRLAEAINSANNMVLVNLNQFLESNQF